ncbi:hypothetical protein [Paraburkholderia sp. BR14320]|uniref:hypothetical protein n=1 Tax=unclassified Paraburkholderia TaxID=2615204 RepID=UPI0034CDCA47
MQRAELRDERALYGDNRETRDNLIGPLLRGLAHIDGVREHHDIAIGAKESREAEAVRDRRHHNLDLARRDGEWDVKKACRQMWIVGTHYTIHDGVGAGAQRRSIIWPRP